MKINIISPCALDLSRFSLTIFRGFTGTLPADELVNYAWSVVVHTVAPAHGPALIVDKDRAPYFVCCQLKVARYVSKTLERAIREKWPCLEGRQRSASHVTASNILVFEFDGLTAESWGQILECLKAAGLTFLAYSTHSYGREDKPGVRVRVLAPMDSALEQMDFTRAWYAVHKILFDGLDVQADVSGRNIHQQQGVWVVHPDRAELAFRHDLRGGVISAQAALAAAPKPVIKPKQHFEPISNPALDVARLAEAANWIDAEDTVTWIKNVTAFKAAGVLVGMEAAKQLVLFYSARGSDKATEKNADDCYDPETFFDSVNPSMPPQIGMAVLCGNARDVAVREVKASLTAAHWTDRGRDAAKYLARHHARVFAELRGAA